MSTTETTRRVVKGNARLRDPRLEQEPTDIVAMASAQATGHADFGQNAKVSARNATPPLRRRTGAEQIRAKAEHH